MSAEAITQISSVEIREFDNVKDLIAYMEEEIAKLRAVLGDLLRRLETAKSKAETMVRLEKLISQLGTRGSVGWSELTLGNVKILVNPTPRQEFDILVSVVRRIQDRLEYLEKLRKDLEPLKNLEEASVPLQVVMVNGLPESIFIKI
ncbi:MAG: hypothetical protein F7C07_07495 [Desulfurococcales archaeon]|nr:hypothetical protein [Desulfurococcales archaeon]